MDKGIKKNMVYNVMLQLFNITYPFITATYISRILGAGKLGIINYSQAISSYALIFGMFGISTYGLREVAKIRDKKNKLLRLFSELIIIKLMATIIVIIVYIITIYNITFLLRENKLYLITSLVIFFNIFNVDWFFGGIEEYRIISLRTIIIRIITLIAIVILIKKEEDYLLYAFLLIIGQCLSNFWSFFISYKMIGFTLKKLNIKRHLKSLTIFFLSTFIVSCYTILNGIILGIYSTPEKVAFFTRAKGFQGMGIAITGAIATVLVPRISYYYHNDKKKYLELLNKSLDYNYIISIPVTCGLMILAQPLNYIFGGEEFIPAYKSLLLQAPIVIILTIGTWMYFQILIPMGKESLGVVIQSIMALTSLALSYMLVPKYHEIGASGSLLITETVGPIILFFILRRKIKIKLITESFFKYILAMIIMGCIIVILKKYLSGITLVFVGITQGVLFYFFSLYVMKEKITLEITSMLLKKNNKKNFS